MMPADRLSAIRIARVNHAGEYGAIRIYGAQIAVCRFLWPRLVLPLSQLKAHEVEHCRLFRAALAVRDGRPCRAMYLWSMGGWVLGAVSTLFGPNLIWVCTEAVEETVHHHLSDQLNWLQPRDGDLHDLIKGIQAEEEGHLDLARSEKTLDNAVTRGFGALVRASVATVVWLSTWGESSQMRRDFARAA